MSHAWISIEELAERLGRDRREVEKLVNRGRIPGRKVGSVLAVPSDGNPPLGRARNARLLGARVGRARRGAAAGRKRRRDADREAHVARDGAGSAVGRTKRSVLESLVEVAGRTWQIWEPAAVLNAVLEREEILSTGFENGVAIPHPRNPLPDMLGQSVIAFGRTLFGDSVRSPAPAAQRFILPGAVPRFPGPSERPPAETSDAAYRVIVATAATV